MGAAFLLSSPRNIGISSDICIFVFVFVFVFGFAFVFVFIFDLQVCLVVKRFRECVVQFGSLS